MERDEPMRLEEKVRENRLRRMAERQRLMLEKSRRRDKLAADFGTWQLLDHDGQRVLGDKKHGYGCTLDEVEAYLTRDRG